MEPSSQQTDGIQFVVSAVICGGENISHTADCVAICTSHVNHCRWRNLDTIHEALNLVVAACSCIVWIEVKTA
jgi:hypothetical protein